MRSNDSQKVLVVGISKTLDDTQLSDLFGKFGAVVEAKVVRDATTNTSRGFGFVTFTAASAMRAAIKGMNQKVIDGRTLNVRQLVPKDTFQAQKKETPDASERPCWLLRKGKCTKGTNCPFSHDIQDGDFGTCFEFVQTGECKHGDACKFSHPQMTAGQDGDEGKKQHDKTSGEKRVCYSFQNGRCHRGKKCLFAHEMLDSEAGKSTGKETKKDEEVRGLMENGTKRRRVETRNDQELMPMKVQKKTLRLATENTEVVGPKKFEWKAKVQETGWEGEMKQEQGHNLKDAQRQLKTIKTDKVDMGAAFDGVSDDEARSKKTVDKTTMRANREKLIQERRAKRNAKKIALSKLRNKGDLELLA